MYVLSASCVSPHQGRHHNHGPLVAKFAALFVLMVIQYEYTVRPQHVPLRCEIVAPLYARAYRYALSAIPSGIAFLDAVYVKFFCAALLPPIATLRI